MALRMSSERKKRIEMKLQGNRIGFLDFEYLQKRNGPRYMYISDVESPIYQKLGVATKLITSAIHIAKIRNALRPGQRVNFIQANVEEHNTAMIRILTKLGFHSAGYTQSSGYQEPKILHYQLRLN